MTQLSNSSQRLLWAALSAQRPGWWL